MTEKLKECPFCGRVPIGPEYHEHDGWRVRCDVLSCMAKVDLRDTEEQAVAAWNRRTPSPAPSAGLSEEEKEEALKASYDKGYEDAALCRGYNPPAKSQEIK